MQTTRTLLLVSLLALSLLGPAAAAPATAMNNTTATETTPPTTVPATPTAAATPTSTPSPTATPEVSGPSGGPNETVLTLDESVAVTDWWYDHDNNEFVITFYSDEYTAVTLVGSPDSGTDSGTMDFEGRALEKNSESVVRIESETGVSFWTDESADEGRAGFLRASQNNPLGGPHDDDDVLHASIGGALGVAVAVLYEAIAAKIAASGTVERVA